MNANPDPCPHGFSRRAICAICSCVPGRDLRTWKHGKRHDRKMASARRDRRKLHRPTGWTLDARRDTSPRVARRTTFTVVLTAPELSNTYPTALESQVPPTEKRPVGDARLETLE